MDYRKIDVDLAYRLLGHGPLVLVASQASDGRPNVAPIAWNCPVQDAPTQVMLAIERTHQTYRNLQTTGIFILCVPIADQAQLVRDLGSVSGKEVDKYSRFNFPVRQGRGLKLKVPDGCLAYLEGVVTQNFELKDMGLILGECRFALARDDGFQERLLVHLPAGKTLHHLGGGVFATPDDEVV